MAEVKEGGINSDHSDSEEIAGGDKKRRKHKEEQKCQSDLPPEKFECKLL